MPGVGTIADIQEVAQDDVSAVLIAGVARARIAGATTRGDDVLWVEAEAVEDEDASEDPEVRRLATEYRAVVEEILELRGIGAMASRILDLDDPGQLADLAVYAPDLSLAQKIEVLETLDVRSRLEKVLAWMDEVLAGLSIRKQIREDAGGRIDKSQREYVLRQQLEAIQKELGETGEGATDYRKQLAEADLPDAVSEAVEREIDKLERTSEQSPENGWIRAWLDTVFELPWGNRTEDRARSGSGS